MKTKKKMWRTELSMAKSRTETVKKSDQTATKREKERGYRI